jgi:hypothetical protein
MLNRKFKRRWRRYNHHSTENIKKKINLNLIKLLKAIHFFEIFYKFYFNFTKFSYKNLSIGQEVQFVEEIVQFSHEESHNSHVLVPTTLKVFSGHSSTH